MSFRLELQPGAIWALVRKEVFRGGHLKLRLEYDAAAAEWFVTGSGLKPIDNLRAESPAVLFNALALVFAEQPLAPAIEYNPPE